MSLNHEHQFGTENGVLQHQTINETHRHSRGMVAQSHVEFLDFELGKADISVHLWRRNSVGRLSSQGRLEHRHLVSSLQSKRMKSSCETTYSEVNFKAVKLY